MSSLRPHRRSLARSLAHSKVARRAGLPPDRVCAEVLPGEKSSKIEELQASLFGSNPLRSVPSLCFGKCAHTSISDRLYTVKLCFRCSLSQPGTFVFGTGVSSPKRSWWSQACLPPFKTTRKLAGSEGGMLYVAAVVVGLPSCLPKATSRRSVGSPRPGNEPDADEQRPLSLRLTPLLGSGVSDFPVPR